VLRAFFGELAQMCVVSPLIFSCRPFGLLIAMALFSQVSGLWAFLGMGSSKHVKEIGVCFCFQILRGKGRRQGAVWRGKK
jgi:hypothetical protein